MHIDWKNIVWTIIMIVGSVLGFWTVEIKRDVNTIERKVTEIQAGIVGMPTTIKKD